MIAHLPFLVSISLPPSSHFFPRHPLQVTRGSATRRQSTTFKKPGGRCAVSAVVSAPSIRLKGRGGSPSGPKIHNLKFIIQNPPPKVSRRRNPLIADLLRRTNPAGNEFWSSRDFAKVLGYADDRNFQSVIESARTACFNSGQRVEDHFVEVTDMVEIGSGAQRPVKTVMMSRHSTLLPELNDEVAAKVDSHLKKMEAAL